MQLFLPFFSHTGTLQEAITSLLDQFLAAAMPLTSEPEVLSDHGTTLRSPRLVRNNPRATARALLSELPGHFEMTPLVSGPERDTLELFFRGVYRDLSGMQLKGLFESSCRLPDVDSRRDKHARQDMIPPERSLTPEMFERIRGHHDKVAEFIEDCVETSPEFFEDRTALFEAYKRWVTAEGYKPMPASEFRRILLDRCPTAVAEKQKRVQDGAVTDLRIRGISGVRLKDRALCRLPADRRFRYRYIGDDARRLARSPWSSQRAAVHPDRDPVVEHAPDRLERRQPALSR